MRDDNTRPRPTESFSESTPLNRSPKICYRWLRRRPRTAVPNSVQIRQWGLLGKWVKYNETLLGPIYTFFGDSRSHPSTDFHASYLTRRHLAQGCAFWGFRWYFSLFFGAPQKILRGVNTRFQARRAKYWKFHIIELLRRFQQNFVRWYRPPISHRGRSQYAPNKSKMADGRHFENC